MRSKLKTFIELAGGPSKVALACCVSRTTVWRWQNDGFPHTDYSGKTNYAAAIVRLCSSNSNKVVTREEVLKAGKPS